MDYIEKLKDPRWQKKRLEIFNRDNWSCTNCGNDKKTLHVHHKKYNGNPWECPDSELKTVCEDCHKKEHPELFLSHEDFTIDSLLKMKIEICEPLKGNISDQKQKEILMAAMKIDYTMMKIRRIYG